MQRNIQTEFENLCKIAEQYGFNVKVSGFIKFNGIVFQSKEIWVSSNLDLKTIHAFTHEIGHAKDFDKGSFNLEKYKSNYNYRLIKEAIAWWYGFFFCKHQGISTKGYFQHAYKMWKNYLKKNVLLPK
ncbi:hypothetical protein [Jeotgalibacillus terrae]|uniref:IrrE N-terminal-like domain-containing protein n=1 Tax=Jeotgalibacillus terrae TaxID=587735 RepID=A0ABW5ZEL9_9BACL|nr:hypothetical protein [Jeotgalibacillus terrae]MBM7580035.1 hypothetical protein [Jeotgalibacillus terrae]